MIPGRYFLALLLAAFALALLIGRVRA